MRWLDGITDLIDRSLSKPHETAKNRQAWHSAVPGVAESRTQLSNRTTTKYNRLGGLPNRNALSHSQRAPLGAQLVKSPPAMRETWAGSLGWEEPLEKGKATQLQYSGLEKSMDCIVHGVNKQLDTTERPSLSQS